MSFVLFLFKKKIVQYLVGFFHRKKNGQKILKKSFYVKTSIIITLIKCASSLYIFNS